MLRAPGLPGALLNPRGEITTGLAILRLTGLGHPRAGVTSPPITLRLRSEAFAPGPDSGRLPSPGIYAPHSEPVRNPDAPSGTKGRNRSERAGF
jgi:hypothetical protein